MRRNTILILLTILIASNIQNSSSAEEFLLNKADQQEQAHFLLGILSLLSGLIGTDIFMAGMRLIW